MASTYSTNLAIELIGTGDQAGSWGNTTNTNLGTLIEQAISGYVTQAVVTGTDTTITIPNGSSGVARNMYIELTGTGGTNTNLIVPANKKLYFIFNNSTGAVTVKVSGQTGVSVPQGKKVVLTSDGTDVVNGLNYIADFGSNSATITQLTATSATITNLTLTSLVISNLSIASANITTLTSTNATAASLTVSTGNLTFSGTGQRITGDMSNATIGNRLAFQNSVTNGNTVLGLLPNGTGTTSALQINNNSDTTAALGFANLQVSTTEFQIAAAIRNAGTYLPMTFYTGGSERMRLDTSGNLGIGMTPSTDTLFEVYGSAAATCYKNVNTGTGLSDGFYVGCGKSSSTDAYVYNRESAPLIFGTANAERMRIDSSGNVGIGGTANAFSRLNLLGTYPTSSNATQVLRLDGTIPSGTTASYRSFLSRPITQAASFTLTNLYHYEADPQTFGAGSAVTNQFGFIASDNLTGATNNYGFYSNIASGSNRWGFYAAGTAQNYFAGNTGVGETAPANYRFWVKGSDSTSSNAAIGVVNSSNTNMFFLRNDNYFNSGAINNYSVAGTTVVIDSNNFLGKTTSSLRYKKDIVNYDKGLAAISKLRPVYYKSAVEGPNGVDPKQHAGLIAEEIEAEGFEEFLIRDNDGRAESIQYPHMVALLVKAMQEQQSIIEQLKADVAALKGA
jgi:hypothetical protein